MANRLIKEGNFKYICLIAIYKIYIIFIKKQRRKYSAVNLTQS